MQAVASPVGPRFLFSAVGSPGVRHPFGGGPALTRYGPPH